MNIANSNMEKLVNLLQSGGVCIIPTDTVYGLACSVKFPKSVAKIYRLKNREGKPGTIIASSVQQLLDMGFIESEVHRASEYWPGPVSVILKAPDSLYYLHMGKKSLAVRV